jgi:DNA-binding Lrp family transcriptional regulator
MTEPGGPAVADVQADLLAWRVASMSLDFLLDVLEVGRRGRDLIDSLLIAAIVVTNLSGIDREAEREFIEAEVGRPVSDDLRRPISINAIAQSLRLPFETTRRRIRALEQEGVVVSTPAGVYVPGAILTQPEYMQIVFARHRRLGEFYRDLLDIGALPAPTPSTPTLPVSAGAVRMTNRNMGEYILRVADVMFELVGDPVSSLILIDMLRANLRGLDDAARLRWLEDPLLAAIPARIAGIAARQQLSSETCRRHVLRLVEAGFCVKSGVGYVAKGSPEIDIRVGQLVHDNLANIQRLFARLRQLGVLALWDVGPKPASSAGRG